ncbi:hypothetical protein BDV93DRAFT_522733 [Ceratobasidium sp. AG-I]|nr:hypothetical protein BDV93DRAFT_522733 [Ceratobasidium sp. AG-I]
MSHLAPTSILQLLPLEVVELIIGRCSLVDILHVSETCRKLFHLVSKSTELQLQIELEATIHLRTYTDGSVHPLAQLPAWTIQLPFAQCLYLGHNTQVEFLGDLLVIRFTLPKTAQNDILIWNWRTGALLNRINIEGTCSFGFPTPDCLSVFNCLNPWEVNNSIGLFIYSDIRRPLVSVPTGATDVCVVANHTALSPSVVLRFPPRMVPLEYIIQHATLSQRSPLAASTSPFKIGLDPSVLHLTMAFTPEANDQENNGGIVLILIPAVCEIFVSIAKLLKYTVAPAPPTDYVEDIPWGKWGEYSTRWFYSATEPLSEESRWVVEGTRAIATNYLGRDNEVDAYDYVTLLDFHPPTVRRFPHAHDGHLSMWKSGADRHVDLASPQKDLIDIWETLEDHSHEGDVFVNVVDENNPSFTSGFGESGVISRLPYRMVTRRMPKGRRSRWTLDKNRIVQVPVEHREEIPGQNLYSRVYTME